MDNVEKIYEAARASGVNPDNGVEWDRALLAAAIELGKRGVTLTFKPDHDEGNILSVIARSDVDLMDYENEEVIVVSDTHEVPPGAGEQLWFVRADDGAIFAAWKSELGL